MPARLVLLSIALFLLLLQTSRAQSTIFIVRHAEKAQGGDAKDPELSDLGRARADTLVTALKDAEITSIYVTDLKRTRQTAEPLARALHLELTVLPANDSAALVAKLKETKGNALVVGHSNTIPEILKALGAPLVYAVEEADYDNLFIFQLGQSPQLLRLHLPAAAVSPAPHD